MCNAAGNTAGRLHRLPEIECLFPKTVEEAVSVLEKHKDSAKILAGGTDILNKMKRRTLVPKYLVNIKSIESLKYVKVVDNELHIGANATYNFIQQSKEVNDLFPMLAETVLMIATPQIRSTGTMLGNLCNAVPSADSAPPLIALGAKIKVKGPEKEREIMVEDFITSPHICALEPDEIAVEITIPIQAGRGKYIKHMLRAEGDLALVGVAVYLNFDANSVCSEAKIALGAVAPTPFRARKAEKLLIGKTLDSSVIEAAACAASEEARPIDDIRSTAEYRSEMVKVLTIRAINNILKGE